MKQREDILTNGPWQIAGNFMALHKWFPSFDPESYRIDRTITWVRIHQLPLHLFKESILLQIARGLEESIMVDVNTIRRNRGKYARLLHTS